MEDIKMYRDAKRRVTLIRKHITEADSAASVAFDRSVAAARSYRSAGRELINFKEGGHIKKGQWGIVVQTQFPERSPRSLQRYMAVARKDADAFEKTMGDRAETFRRLAVLSAEEEEQASGKLGTVNQERRTQPKPGNYEDVRRALDGINAIVWPSYKQGLYAPTFLVYYADTHRAVWVKNEGDKYVECRQLTEAQSSAFDEIGAFAALVHSPDEAIAAVQGTPMQGATVHDLTHHAGEA